MKTEKTGWLLLFTGLLLVTAGFVLTNGVSEGLKDILGVVSMGKVCAEVKPEWRADEPLSPDTMKLLKKEYGDELVTYTVKTVAQKQTRDWSGKTFDAAVAGADNTHPTFHTLMFKDGRFFPTTRKNSASKTAIVSENFAWKLFRTVDASGMELELYGENFRITGVFETSKNILNTLIQPGLPDIIIPAETMLELDEKAYIDSVELVADESVTFGGNEEEILSALKRAGADTNQFIVTDFVLTGKSIIQRPFLIVYTAGLIAAILWFFHMLRIFVSLARQIRGIRSIYSQDQALWPVLVKYVLKLILPIAAITSLILLLSRNSFDFYFPAEYIPGEKLEGQKYMELMKESLRQLFSGIEQRAPINVKLLQAADLFSGAVFRLALLPGFFLVWQGNACLTVQRTVGEISRCTCQTGNIEKSSHILQNYILDGAKAEGMPISRMLGKAGVLQVICMLAACALCTLSDLPLQVFTEGILILWLLTATGFITKIQKHHMNEGSVFIV